MQVFIQAVGWIGTFLIVLAYFLVSSKRLTGDSKVYQLMNLVGALGVGINVFYQRAWPALALQIIWGIISIVTLVRIWNLRHSAEAGSNILH